MGLHLIALTWALPEGLVIAWNIFLVVLGLGLVIFVHELGHFVVAKLCGVKCEKFYLGFDIGGLKLAKFQWGETEYGIGILPLGGYVKMLGQEDNPSKVREEMERARVRKDGAPADEASDAGHDTSAEGSQTPVELDPRSYLAQSVPERMAIISAGVVMNVIFAVAMGALAYALGVFHVDCGIGEVVPGTAAWNANLKVGDQIVRIDGEPARRFVDLKAAMSVGDVENGVPLTIVRPGVEEPFTVKIEPNKTKPVPTIGVLPPHSLEVVAGAIAPWSAAGQVKNGFKSGDRVVAINGEPVERYADVFRQQALRVDETITFTVERSVQPPEGGPGQPPKVERVEIQVPPEPMRVVGLGLIMSMGPISGVQADSPAAKAGLKEGDIITRVDGEPVGDPMTLPERLRRRALEADSVRLLVRREGESDPMEFTVPLRRAEGYEVPALPASPLSAPAIGIAYRLPARVESVVPGSAAAAIGLQGGEVITKAEFIFPRADSIEDENRRKLIASLAGQLEPIDLTENPNSWPSFYFYTLQNLPPELQVRLTFANGHTVTAQPIAADNWSQPDRGVQFDFQGSVVTAESAGDALKLGVEETAQSMTLVFQLLGKITSRFRAMGGPVTIAKMAYAHASQGLAEFAVFLMMISANLAVLNFLPIPVLDGGHMVFLAYEGITGRPPDERVFAALSYLGLFLILGLMILVLGLDFGLISRQ